MLDCLGVFDKVTYIPTVGDVANEGIYLARRMQVIGAGRNTGRRVFKNLVCGHEQEFATHAIRSGLFRCNHCQIDKFTKEADDL